MSKRTALCAIHERAAHVAGKRGAGEAVGNLIGDHDGKILGACEVAEKLAESDEFKRSGGC